MPTNSLKVTLLAPGCFASVGNMTSNVTDAEAGIGEAEGPALNDSAVIVTHSQSLEQALFVTCALPAPELGRLPAAQFGNRLPGQIEPNGCVCAELVHLQADKDNAVLIPQRALDVQTEHVSALYASLHALLEPDGIHVVQDSNDQWYLVGMDATHLNTWPAHALARRDVAAHLPRSAEAGDWRRLFTETQMLFHDHPVNTERAARQQVPVNGVWFWGGATASLSAVEGHFVVFANDAYSHGFCEAANITQRPLSEFDASSPAQNLGIGDDQHCVICDLALYNALLGGNAEDIQQARLQLNTNLIEPLQLSVNEGRIGTLTIDGCEGHAIVERATKSMPAFKGSNGAFSRIKQWFSQ